MADEVLNFSYTGASQNTTLQPGTYQLEVWGAAGGNGNNSATYAGGKGGYAKGTLTLTAATRIYVYVGGKGKGSSSNGIQSGGWNGGGAGGYGRGGSGGGATDMRTGGTALSNRIIVAGGGGGGAYYSGYKGGYGGGSSGGDGTGYNTTYNAKGGTQNGGGAGGGYTNYKGSSGTSGNGGASVSVQNSNYGKSGGGGGGYYGGGGGGYRNSSSYYYQGQSGGGGGSGYVASSLTNTQNIAGNTSFTDPDGSTVTGHSGDGYARITKVATGPATPSNFRSTATTFTSVSLAWNSVSGATGYKIYKDNTLLQTQTSRTYTVSGLAPGESHTYEVTAYDGSGESDPASLTVSTNTITTPGILQQTGQTYTSITLGWTTSGSVDGYHIYRGGTLVGTVSALTYTNSNLSPGQSYSYSVKAYVGSYESAAATITASTKAVSAPTGFIVSGTDYTALTLSWDSSDVNGWKLYRGSTLLTTTSSTSYTDTNLIPDTSYNYSLKAYVGNVESSAVTVTGKTEFAIYYSGPEIDSATFTVNPVNVGATTKLQVVVADVVRVLLPEHWPAGELRSGEQ